MLQVAYLRYKIGKCRTGRRKRPNWKTFSGLFTREGYLQLIESGKLKLKKRGKIMAVYEKLLGLVLIPSVNGRYRFFPLIKVKVVKGMLHYRTTVMEFIHPPSWPVFPA